MINPKKIKGQDKLNRIKDLMGKMGTLQESKSFSELELIKKGPNNVVYGIIRENHDYFIKTTDKTSGELTATDFNYIGGVQNKYDERYKTYNEALKRLNIKFDVLNESFGVKSNNNIFESDGVAFGGHAGFGFVVAEEAEEDEADIEIEEPGDKELLDEEGEVEEQKKVIKVDAPAAPAVEAPIEDEVSVDEFGDEGGDDFGAEEEVEVDMEVSDDDDPTKKIQKLTGKVTQQMRELEEPDPELDKYVINSVISAIDWEGMSDEDIEDVIAKIEGEEEEDAEGAIDVEIDAEETIEEPVDELAEGVGDDYYRAKSAMDKLTSAELTKLSDVLDKMQSKKDEDVEREEDPKERVKHEKGREEDDEKIEADAKKDAEEAKKKEEEDKEDEKKNESRTFSKKQLIESFLKKNVNLALKKVLKENQSICEECLGEGCEVCEGEEENDDRSSFIDIIKQNIKAAHDKGEKSPWDSAEPANVVKQKGWASLEEENKDISRKEFYQSGEDNAPADETWQERQKRREDEYFEYEEKYMGSDFGRGNKSLGEDLNIDNALAVDAGDDVDVVKEMDVATAIATGQDYLSATGDLDRDGDQIPNRLDMDNNADGELDYETFDNGEDYIEIDIDALMGNNPAPAEPTTKPGTKPTTRPGKGKPRWKKIPRPNVDPRPKALKERKKSTTKRSGMYK